MPRFCGLKASNAGHNYGWLYDTFQSSLLTLQLAVVRFVVVPTGLYMSHAVSLKLLIEFEPSRLLSSPPTRKPWCSRAWGAQDHDAAPVCTTTLSRRWRWRLQPS